MAQEDSEPRREAAAAEHVDVEVEREHDAPAVEELDEETRARRDAALRQVRKFGDPVLRASALQVERFDDQLQTEIERMGELMHDALGVGLAATQLGIMHRVLVYRAFPEDQLTALVNPMLEWASEEREQAEEGCLSLPGVHVEVERPARVRVRARDGAGKETVVEAEGLPARIVQHEMDHLDGVLILDRISREARKEAMRAMRAAMEGRPPPAPQGDDGSEEPAREAAGEREDGPERRQRALAGSADAGEAA
jgi:peptide deformylase